MSFSVVIVLHDSGEHLRRLLASFDRVALRPQVICVDSGSRDDGPQIARTWGAELLTLDGNPGFGAANNAGLALAQHEVTVLLNPDCVLLDDGLTRLAALAQRREALIVPRLLNPDGSVQRSAHPRPGTIEGLIAAVVPPRILPARLRVRLEPYRAEAPRTVGWAIAACVAGRTTLLRRLGPFDARAFLFYEDLQLCLDARAAGVPTVLHPQIELTHVGGHATGPALGTGVLELEAARRRTVVGAACGPRALRIDDLSQWLTFRLRALVRREPKRNRAMAAALRLARRSS
ncbi:unannotated protein [freshwater metagenome]|uniref:Unannotated protein n=1 Tax=freshwater metagenome TaxID=449393 RepID=A0A6J7III9_9ZZZZ|nr:glycosyltransferase [Actinomycetota bacterium]